MTLEPLSLQTAELFPSLLHQADGLDGLRLGGIHVAGLASSLSLTDQLGRVGATALRAGERPRGLDILGAAAWGLDVLRAATRSLDILRAATRRLHVLGAAARGLHILRAATRRLDVLRAATRRLDILGAAARGLNILLSLIHI